MSATAPRPPVRRAEPDAQLQALEREWCEAYAASIAARAAYQSLARRAGASVEEIDAASERADRAAALQARIMLRIERIEELRLARD